MWEGSTPLFYRYQFILFTFFHLKILIQGAVFAYRALHFILLHNTLCYACTISTPVLANLKILK